jgi:hypothetical protein
MDEHLRRLVRVRQVGDVGKGLGQGVGKVGAQVR